MSAGSNTDGSTKIIDTQAQPAQAQPAQVQRVLVPLDDSDASRQVLSLLRGFFAPGEVELVLFGASATRADLETKAMELLEAGFAVQVVTAEYDNARSIIDYVNSTGIDMIAIGSLNRSGKEKSAGISERVLRSANVPVLLLRAAA